MPSSFRLAAQLLIVTALAGCSRQASRERPAAAGSSSSALFTNGDFGTGDLTGWTLNLYSNPGLAAVPPASFGQLNLQAGNANHTSVKTGAIGSIVPSGLSAGSTLRVPKYSSHVAVVNELGASNSANGLRQTMTTSNADVDPADNKVHVRFAIAPVLQNPGHPDDAQPYFWVQLYNVTKSVMLFHTFNFSNQPGVPWKTDPLTAVLYTDWQAFDIAPGPAQLAVGDQVEMLVVASGCAYGGHYGEVYVESFGPKLPGLTVTATAPQQVNTGTDLAYTFTYRNDGTGASTNTTIVEHLPAGTTFQSVNAPGASCTTPAVGGTGAVTCNVGTVNPAASGSFTVTVHVTAANGSTLSNGNYEIHADSVSALIGPLVTTSVTSGVQYADLSATVTDGVAAVGWGTSTTYALTVANQGPAAADGATLSDPLPANVASWTWTCAASGGAACPNATGSGAISETIATFPSGGSLAYTISAAVDAGSGSGTLVHQATVAPPPGVTDNNSSDDIAVDTDQIGTLETFAVVKAGPGSGTVVSSPAAINCGSTCSADFMQGTSVVLTATAAPGNTFDGWSGGGCSGAQATCTVAVTSTTTVTATFSRIHWNVTGSAPGGNGTVTCDTPVNAGDSSSCAIAPAAGHYLSALTDNGADVLGSVSGGVYVVSDVQANHGVVGTFLPSVATIALGAAPASSTFGEPVTFTAALTGVTPSGTPGGTVTFQDGGTPIAGCAAVAVSSGSATCTTSALGAGTHPVTAVSSGDATYGGLTSATTSYVVSQAGTSLALADGPVSPTLNGVAVTLTATVSTGAGTPTGAVAFTDGGVTIAGCGAVALSGGVAACTTPAVLGVGTHPFQAAYTGDADHLASSSSLSHDVLRVGPAVALASDGSPSLFGQPSIFTVTASSAFGTPTGSVIVLEGATPVCGPLALTAGVASCSSSALAVGTHVLTAQYGGDLGFLPAASGAISQLVVRGTSTTSVTGDMVQSVYGQTVTFTATVDPDAPSVVAPTGTVTFRDGSTVMCANVAISGGQATCQAATLAVGWHAVSARYNGSTGYAPSTSFSFALQVNQAATSVALTPSPGAAVVGQLVTLSIDVTAVQPGTGTPTGTVSVSDGASPIAGCTGLALAGGHASCGTAALGVGAHPLSVSYRGETRYLASSAGPQSLTVSQAATSALVASSPNPSVFGQPVTFAATVAVAPPGAGTPGGTVTFSDGATVLGTGTLDGAGHATYSTSALPVGSHGISVSYAGDASFLGSSSAPSAHVVQPAATTTVVSTSATPAVYGQPVTFTATVTALAPGAGTPGGTVTFKDASATIGSGAINGAGVASFTTAALDAGSHFITAQYEGAASFNPSSSFTLAQSVSHAPTHVALAGGPNPAVFGEPVTFSAVATADAPSGAVPAGTVQFMDGAALLASIVLDGQGHASFTTSGLSAATHTVTAVLVPSPRFAGSTSPALAESVLRGTSAAAVASSLLPATYGDAVTFTATVTAVAPASGTPSGTVTFRDGAAVLGTRTLDGSGAAALTTSALDAGPHQITVDYAGDAGFLPVTSPVLTQPVTPAPSAVALVSAPAPSVFGQPAVFTATVTSAGAPGGTVSLEEGGVALGSAQLDGSGQAAFTTASLPVGAHLVVARYQGDANHAAAASPAYTHTVNKASLDLALTVSPTPTVSGQPAILRVTATPRAPGAGTPTGTVTFYDNGVAIGSGTLDGSGVATFTIASLAAGSHPFTAIYAGDPRFNGAATSGSTSHTVQKGSITVAIGSSPAPSVFGQPVTLSVTVAPVAPAAGTPTGSVTLSDGATVLATLTLSSGAASTTTSALAVGTHALTASYPGDAAFLPGSGSGSQVIGQAATATALASSASPSRFGQSVTFTATVTATGGGAGTPTGTVTFKDGATVLGTGSLDGSGAATFTSSALAVGSHALAAQYAGDASFTGSGGSFSQAVQKGATQLALGASPSPSIYGQATTLTATVAAVAPASGIPAGTVTFKDGGTALGTGTLDAAGRATLSVSSLHSGAHALAADYAGDASFAASSGSAALTVQQGPATVTVTSSRNPSRRGRPVVIAVTVTSPHATPTGDVIFKDGDSVLETATLASGCASYTVRSLVKGTHPITVAYAGGADFAAATGSLPGGEVVENTPPVAGSGTALALDGATSATIDASSGALDVTSGTVDLWARAGWSAPTDVQGTPSLLSLGDGAAARFALAIAPDRKHLLVRLGETDTTVPAALDDGAWHHLALVSETGHLAVYLDGAAAATLEGGFASSIAGKTLTLGDKLVGEIDEVRLWSKARDAAALAADLRRPLRGDEDGLIGYWRMDEGEGGELFDASPSHLDGTVAMAPGAPAGASPFAESGAWRHRHVFEERALPVDAGYDADGDPLTLTVSTQPAHGAATADSAGLRVDYSPAEKYLGDDRFAFTLADGEASSTYTIDVAVDRILACQSDADCGGGDVCMQNVCVAPHALDGRSGSGCAAGGGGATLLSLLALALLAWRRGRAPRELARVAVRSRGIFPAIALAAFAQAAAAQTPKGFALQTYEPSPPGDRFFVVPEATMDGHAAPAAGLLFSWASEPLVLRQDGVTLPGFRVVHRQSWAVAQGSVPLGDLALVDAAMPFAFYQSGSKPFSDLAQVSAGLGDLRLGARAPIPLGGPVKIAAAVDLWLPTGSRDAFSSDGRVRALPKVIAGAEHGSWLYGAELGFLARGAEDLGYTRTGSAIAFAGGAAWRWREFRVGPEIYGRYQFDGTATSPVEALVGGRWQRGPVEVGLSLGAGLDRAPGAAPFRAVAQLVWRPEAHRNALLATAPAPARDEPAPGPALAASPEPPPVVIAEAAPRPPSPADEAPPRPDPEAAPARAVLTRAAIQIAQAIRFENDLAVIRPGSEVVLGDVAAIFRAHPEIGKVRVEGYTDSNGDAAHNMRLSRMRAQAVQRWLVEKGGVDAARLDADGFGASRPVAPNVTQAGRARNRRVEFRIVGVQ